MKKTICFAAIVLMLSATGHAQEKVVTTGGVIKLPFERDVVKGQPYSAEIETDFVQTLADGNRIVRRTTGRVFRDSEGRVRREEDQASGAPLITITDALTHVSYVLEPALRIARETPSMAPLLETMKSLEAASERVKVIMRGFEVNTAGGGQRGFVMKKSASVLDPIVEERLADRVIEGVLASGIRVTTTFPAGAIGNEQPIKVVSEEWKSPELQVLVLTDRIDPQTGRSTYRLLRINRAEPDASLFQVPFDYAVLRTPGIGRGLTPRER